MDERARPTLGMVLMEDDYAVESGSVPLSPAAHGSLWAIQDPAAWPVPVRTAVAGGAGVSALLAADPAALSSVVAATRRLDGDVDLIVGNCGFMCAAQPLLESSTVTPTILSSMGLLGLGLSMTAAPVGVITFDTAALECLLVEHPQRERIRVLGLERLPDWAAINGANFMERSGWSMNGLREQLVEHVARALRPDGELDGVRVVILECTCLVNFRDAIRSITSLPLLDIAAFARAALT